MTQSDRLNRLLDGKPVDRVLFSPLDMSCGATGFSALNVGYPLGCIFEDPERSFLAQLWTQHQYLCDGLPVFGYASYGAWEFGGKIKFPVDELEQAPSIVKHPLTSEADVELLEVPEVAGAGMVPSAMRFSRLQAEHGMPVTVFWTSPFTLAANLVDVAVLCRWTIKKPLLVHRLLRLATDHILEVARLWVRTFEGERIIVREVLPVETNQMISFKTFLEFAFPYLEEVHETVLKMGVKHFALHICGDQNLNLPQLAKLPMGDCGIVSFGHEVDLTTAIEHFGDTCVIAGNVEPVEIQLGTPQKVYELSRQCIEKGKQAPRGFILSPGCDLPPFSPPHNVFMMAKAVEDFGKYN